MAVNPLTVATTGQTLTVAMTTVRGGTPTYVYVDQGLSTLATWPATITADTTWWLSGEQQVVVSATALGVELGPFTVTGRGGGNSLKPYPSGDTLARVLGSLAIGWGSSETTMVNVRDQRFGATGDSVTDDTAAILAADAALGPLGGIVYLPAGVYAYSATLAPRQGVTYLGDGPLSTILQMHTLNADGIRINDAHTGATIRTRIEGLQVAAVGAAFHAGYGAGISGGASTNVLVDCALRDVWVQGFGGWGIVLTTIITSTLDSVSASDNGHGVASGGICLVGTGGYTPTSTHLNNCYSNNNVGIGFDIVDTNYSVLNACAADTNHQGYQIVGGQCVSLISCGTEDMRAVGSDGGGHGTGDGFTIVGGTGHSLQSCMAIQNPHVGFYVTGSASNITLVSPTEQSTTGTPVAGIMVEPGSTATVINPSTVTAPVYAAGTTTVVGNGIRPPGFATGSRPSASAAGAGTSVYDTTLHKPIWSSGTAWLDAAGNAV